MKILITGISGLLGNNLGLYFCEKAQVTGFYKSHSVTIPGVNTLAIDLCDYVALRKVIVALHPDVIIHCASRTDVDGIEKDREGGWQANVWTTKVLLEACRDSTAKFVYISTDSVYPGTKGPYSEKAIVKPRNWYGATKLEAENLVADRAESLILRTNIYGWNIQDKESIAEWFLRSIQQQGEVQGFADARFSSIYTFSFARIIEQCLQKQLSGLYNCACSDSLSKYEFGVLIAKLFGFDQNLVKEIKLDSAEFVADRGYDLSLDVHKLATDLGHPLPTMYDSLSHFYSDWQLGLPKSIRQNKVAKMGKLFYPHRQEIPYGRQAIDDHDIDMVVGVLKSPFLTQGPVAQEFEAVLAGKLGCKYAIAVNSGTAALHLACLVSGVGPGDEVITSANTFVASANCAVYCGARPVIADINPLTYNISLEDLENKITKNTKAIIPVHFAGQSCNMQGISEIVKKAEKKYGHKIFIIEDACHALGSRYRDFLVGSCVWSDMTVMSFHPVKHITTGEGGVVLTNNSILENPLRQLRSHGITNQPNDFINISLGYHAGGGHSGEIVNPWYYEQQKLGYNYRITDIQCALGISQLEKLDEFIVRRKSIVARYNKELSGNLYLQAPFEVPDCDSNFHLYVALIDFKALDMCRAHFIAALNKDKIYTQVHYIPVHMQPYYQDNFGTKLGGCPNAEAYYEKCLSLPLYPAMTEMDVEHVVNHVTSLLCMSGQ